MTEFHRLCPYISGVPKFILGLIYLGFTTTSGCAWFFPLSEEPAVESMASDLEHKVTHQGETLGLISAWYTGSASNWPVVAAANEGLNPNLIKPGDIIRIPRALVVRAGPLPMGWVRPSRLEKQKNLGGSSHRKNNPSEMELQPPSENGATPHATSEDIPAFDPGDALLDYEEETRVILEGLLKERGTEAVPTPQQGKGQLSTGAGLRDDFLKEMLDESLNE